MKLEKKEQNKDFHSSTCNGKANNNNKKKIKSQH